MGYRPVCAQCDIGYALSLTTFTCEPVATKYQVYRCALYRINNPGGVPVCAACLQGFVPLVKDKVAKIISCTAQPDMEIKGC